MAEIEKTVANCEVEVATNSGTVKVVEDFINNLLAKMNMDAKAYIEEDSTDEKIKVNIKGKDSAKVIGYRGESLDAIQYLAVIEANKNNENEYIKVIVDSENYRDKRNVTLNSLAKKLAYKASRSNRRVELEPMNPFERRIIHTALQNNQYVETISEGEGIQRHVVIVPKKKKQEDVSLDILGASNSNFKKNGPKKMRSFGYSKNRF